MLSAIKVLAVKMRRMLCLMTIALSQVVPEQTCLHFLARLLWLRRLSVLSQHDRYVAAFAVIASASSPAFCRASPVLSSAIIYSPSPL